MSRVGNPASPPLVTELALTVSHFETENARLASQLDLLDGRQTLRDEGEPTHDGPGTPSQVFSRRGALMAMGGVAAGGLGLAVGSTMLSAEAGAADSGSAVSYLPDPTRIYDTRVAGVYPANPPIAQPMQANSGIVITIGGLTLDGTTIPATATGVIGNVTVVNPVADGYLTLYPVSQTGPPPISTLNFQKGDIARANFCMVRLNGGEMIIYTQATTDVVFDVTGYTI